MSLLFHKNLFVLTSNRAEEAIISKLSAYQKIFQYGKWY